MKKDEVKLQENKKRRIQYIKDSIKAVFRGEFSKVVNEVILQFFYKFRFTTKGNVIKKCKDVESASEKYSRIAVYSCIIGDYDRIIEPVVTENGVDYFMFSDKECLGDSKWNFIDVKQFKEYYQLSQTELNRRIKLLPFKYLKGYDYTIYVDGNVRIASDVSGVVKKMGTRAIGVHYHHERDCIYDEGIVINILKKSNKKRIKRQLRDYKKAGFPRHEGLYANGIIICNHNNPIIREIMNGWWKEYIKYSTRDQICLPYVLWKNNIPKEEVYIMGRNVYKNDIFQVIGRHE